MKLKVVISDRIRFSKKLLPKKMILKRYDRAVYDEPKCDSCENRPERHNDLCDNCPAFVGRYRFFSKTEEKAGIWSVPQGDYIAVVNTLRNKYPDIKVVDKRERLPFKHNIKFTGTLYGAGETDDDGRPRANQKKAVKNWLRYEHGILRAAPRTGKTVMATYLYCKLQQKTVIIASQKEWLKQFYETAVGRAPPTFRGNKNVRLGRVSPRRKAVTNIPELQRKTGKEIIRYIDKFSQLVEAKENYDIVLMTYQALMRDPERITKYLNGRYSFCIVDEGHKGSAPAFLRVLAQLNMAARLTLTATDKRKDSRDKFGEMIYGPVVSTSKTTAMVPHINFIDTNIKLKPMPKRWSTALRRVCYNTERNKLLVRNIFADLRAGHRAIIVPLSYIQHIEGLTKMINRQAMINNKKRDEDWPITLARSYHGKTDRDEILHWVDSKKWDIPNKALSKEERGPAPRVLVARDSMIKEGIDFARPTSMHITIPMSGNSRAGAPAFYQLTNRVCTPIANKKQPVVRVYIDQVNMFRGAISGLLWHEIYPNSNLKKLSGGNYYLSKENYMIAKILTKKLTDKKASIFDGSWV